MTTQHTPAPWKTGDSDWHTIVGPHTRFKSTHLVGIANVEESDDSNEDASNARLIAAAPELLAALQSINEWFEESSDYREQPEQIAWANGIARAAIAKATNNATPN